jgi:hypothetical protein
MDAGIIPRQDRINWHGIYMFDVTPEDILALNDETLRTLIAYLCEAECRLQNISASGVTWGGNQNAKDGGIDVKVELAPKTDITGYIARPITGFQVKAEDMPKNKIESEMAPDGSLRESIKELAEKNGAYIIASSQGSVSDLALTNRKNAMAATISSLPDEQSLVVDFYDRTRIATWVNQHPGLVTWVRECIGRPLSGWQPFKDWSSWPGARDDEYLLDEGMRIHGPGTSSSDGVDAIAGIQKIRGVVSEPKGAVRIVGLSGVGKTRFVQALFDNRLGETALDPHLAVYCDISDKPSPVPQELLSRLIASNHRAILIVDNCGPDLHQKLVRRIKQEDSQISVITVEYDITDDEPEGTQVYKLEPSSVELVEKIISQRFPAIGHPNKNIIAEFSGGNARVAFALADTVEQGESLVDLKDTDLFNRLFVQTKDADAELLAAAKACALVYSFDGETLKGEDAELPFLATVVGMEPEVLYGRVAELHRRQLVQKRGKWRAVLPHALAHRLAKLALDDIPYEKIEGNLIKGSNARLLKSFSRRLGYLHDSPLAQKISASWLNDAEMLQNVNTLNELEITLLRNIAPVNPEQTLKTMEKAAANEHFTSGKISHKSEIQYLLRSLAYDVELFDRAASILLDFALKEDITKNTEKARDLLRSLFFLYLSGTHASTSQRLDFIRTIQNSDDPKNHEIAISLLSAMLEAIHFTSHYPFDFGARPRDYGWEPKTNEELRDWYDKATDLALEIAQSDQANARAAKKLLAEKFRSLCSRVGLTEKMVRIGNQLSKDGYWAEGWLAIRSTLRFHRDKMPDDTLKLLEGLEKRLAPAGLEQTTRTHALSKQWGVLDIAELDPDSEERPSEVHDRIAKECEMLGKELVSEPAVLEKLLPDILVTENTRVWNLGKGLGLECPSIEETWKTLTQAAAKVDSNTLRLQMLSGFLNGAHERDAKRVDGLLENALSDDFLRKNYPYFQSTIPMSEEGADRLSRSIKFDDIPTWTYRNLAYGRTSDDIPSPQLDTIIDGLSQKDGGIAVGAEILGMRAFGKKRSNERFDELERAIGRKLISNINFERGSDREDRQLGEIISFSFTDQSQESEARAICEKLLLAFQSYKATPWNYDDVISEFARVFPEMVLDVFVEAAERVGRMGRGIFGDIREFRTCPLDAIPTDSLLRWTQENPNERFLLLAKVVRFYFEDKETKALSWSPVATKLIAESPDVIAVLNVFFERFSPTSWSGSRAEIIESRRALLAILTENKNSAINEWAENKIQILDEEIKRERTWEENSARERDERFED